MSWIRPKSDDPQSTAVVSASEPNYNRDMNSPPLPSKQEPSSAGQAKIGQSIQIEGTLSGNEDVIIDGSVQGTVKLNGHSLIVGPNGKIRAGLSAKSVTVQGEVNGNITANDKIQIASSGSVKGDLRAPRIALDDGASFKGSVDMGTEKAKGASEV